METISELLSKYKRSKIDLSVGFVSKVSMSIVVVVPGIQAAEFHLPKRQTPDVVIVDQGHG